MLMLRTLGPLCLEGPNGTLTGENAGRLPLALLALVAASPPGGVSRDRVIAYLWPDSDSPHARHSLNQTIYALRKDLAAGSLVTGAMNLVLAPHEISSDLQDLRGALARGDVLFAASNYRGPFLDGFHLSGHGEFEEWVEQTRTGVLRQLTSALERALRMADGVEARLDIASELVRLDRFSTPYAVALMTALEEHHAPVSALQALQRHVAALGAELDMEPPESVLGHLARLRAVTQTITAPPPPAGPPPDHPAAAGINPPLPSAEPATWLRAARWPAAAALLLVGAAATLSLVLRTGRARDPQPILVIGAVREAGASPADTLGPLLAQALEMATGRFSGAGVVSHRWLDEAVARGTTGWIGAAASAGATDLLEGMLSRAGTGGFDLRLTLTDVHSGRIRFVTSVRAPDLLSLVDSATRAVAVGIGLPPPTERVPVMGSASWEAISFYHNGMRLMERGDLLGAYRMLSAASDADSSFAVAAFWAWHTAQLLDLPERSVLLTRAVRAASTAPMEERLYILGYFEMSHNRALVAADYADSAVRLFPSHAQAHVLAGQVYLTEGRFVAAIAEARHALRLLEGDESTESTAWRACAECGAVWLLSTSYAWMDSLPAAERALRAALGQHPRNGMILRDLIAVLNAQARAEEVVHFEAALAAAAELPQPQGLMTEELMLRSGDPAGADRLLARRPVPAAPDMLTRWRWLRLIALRNQGRQREVVQAVVDGWWPSSGRDPDTTWHAEAYLEGLAYQELGDHRRAAKLFSDMAGAPTDRQPGSGQRAWWLAQMATSLAALGDTTRLLALADTIEALGARSLYGRDQRLHHYVRGLAEVARGRDAAAVEHLRDAIHSPNCGFTRVNLELGRSLLRQGRPADAVPIVGAALRCALDASNFYVTRTELHDLLADAYDQAGRVDSAVLHYRIVPRSWANADPKLQPRVRHARDRLDQLGATGP